VLQYYRPDRPRMWPAADLQPTEFSCVNFCHYTGSTTMVNADCGGSIGNKCVKWAGSDTLATATDRGQIRLGSPRARVQHAHQDDRIDHGQAERQSVFEQRLRRD